MNDLDEAVHHILWMLWFDYGDDLVEGVEIKGSLSLVSEFLEKHGYAEVDKGLIKINNKAIVLMEKGF